MSGFPARSFLCNLNRNPIPCAVLRTAISGNVFLLLTRDISFDLRSRANRSIAFSPQPEDILTGLVPQVHIFRQLL